MTLDNTSTLRLNDICEAIVDCEHKTAPIQDDGIPSIRTTDIKNGRIDFKSANKVSEETYRDWTKRLEPRPLDLILAREAPVGEVGIIPPGQKACLGQRTVLIRPNQSKVNPYYLVFLLASPNMKFYLGSLAEGSVVPHLNMSEIRDLELPNLPSLSEQKAIAAVLSTLDDKIELNRRMNETLEAMAKALFKSWFVDFDPVRAKAEGRQPEGLTPELAALFPDGFEDSELGEIPKGWKVQIADQLFEIGIGKTPPRKESEWFTENPNDITWVSIKDMGQAQTFINTSSEFLTSEAVNKFNVRVVPENTVLVSFKLTVGRLAITTKPITTNEAIAHFKTSEKSHLNTPYTYFYLKHYDFSVLGSTSSIATAVNSQSIKSIKFIVPRSELLFEFSNVVSPILEKIKINCHQIESLSLLRDSLLPKLMSGEIRVQDAEAMVEAVV